MNLLAGARWLTWAAAATLTVCLGTVQAAADASPPPGSTDPGYLSSILVGPPAQDYIAAPVGMVGPEHIGQLDVDSLVAESGGSASVRAVLQLQGFTRGYRSLWIQQGTSAVLIERVEEFQRNAGAQAYLAQVKVGSQHAADFRGFFATSGIGGGYGARLVDASRLETDTVVFVKGNLFFVVTAAQTGRSSTDVALNQAQDQYAGAPDETIVQPSGSALAAAAVATALLATLVGLAAVVLVLVLVARRRRQQRPLPVFADPNYRWDGGAWRPADPPERRR